MADIALFIDHIRDRIAAEAGFTTSGFNREQVYRQYLPQVKDPVFPCITLSFEKDKTEVFADVAIGTLYISVHMKQFSKVQDVQKWLTSSMHQHTFSDGTLVIWMCQEQGSPPTPSWDEKTQTWESIQSFDVRFG